MNGKGRAVSWVLPLALLAGCFGGSETHFPKGQEPKVWFYQLDLAKYVRQVSDPQDAVEIGVKITNRSDAPIELVRARLRVVGQVVAQVRRQDENVSQQIPSNDSRIVRMRMTLLSAQSPTTSSGPMIPSLRGQLFFKTAQGTIAVSVNETLTEPGDSGEEEEQ